MYVCTVCIYTYTHYTSEAKLRPIPRKPAIQSQARGARAKASSMETRAAGGAMAAKHFVFAARCL